MSTTAVNDVKKIHFYLTKMESLIFYNTTTRERALGNVPETN